MYIVNPEALKEYTDELDELIKELNRAVQEYKDRPETQEAIADLLDKAEELKELLEEYGVNFEDGIQEEDFDQIKALVEEELAKFEEDFEAAKARGVKFGREAMQRPINFNEILQQWKNGEISARKAAKLLNISTTTFISWSHKM